MTIRLTLRPSFARFDGRWHVVVALRSQGRVCRAGCDVLVQRADGESTVVQLGNRVARHSTEHVNVFEILDLRWLAWGFDDLPFDPSAWR